MKKTTFLENGQFYKGNIHCHTTCSDGKLSPDAIVKAYQDKGYDFLAITDHNVFSHYTCYDTDRFVMIQGVEGNLRAPATTTGSTLHCAARPGWSLGSGRGGEVCPRGASGDPHALGQGQRTGLH